MNKIDLIIDALENIEPIGLGWRRSHKHRVALAAARELRALKPVVKVIVEDGGVCFELLDKKLPVGTILYALDGEQA
jgi:hypothetical protein